MADYDEAAETNAFGLSMQENEDGKLLLTFAPNDLRFKIDPEGLRRMATEQGHGMLCFDEKALLNAARSVQKNEPFFGSIATRLDAEYHVVISSDRLIAQIEIHPPFGGKALNLDDAFKAVADARISFGLDKAKVVLAMNSELGRPVEIAKGVAAIIGRDTRFEPLVDVNRERIPREKEDGRVDWRDLGDIPIVNPGDPVMRRYPPEKGVIGRDIYGNTVHTVDGKFVDYPHKLEGVERDPHDATLLRAAIVGQPVLLRDSVKVEPIIKMPGVNISSGNVTFAGSVIINGDVQAGMHIKVDGDVTVDGTVEAATIEAGGSIIVKGGIVGQGGGKQRDSAPSAATPSLHAKADIRAKYAENAVLIAEKSVFIEEAVIECDITALEYVTIGTKGRRKGYIMGGRVRATLGIKAEFLGGPGSRQARVMVGVNPLLQQRIEEKKQRIAALVKEEADLKKLIQFLADKPDRQDTMQKAENTLRRIQDSRADTFVEERALTVDAELAEHAKVEIGVRVHAGSTVNVGKASMFIPEDTSFGVFRLDQNQVVFSRA